MLNQGHQLRYLFERQLHSLHADAAEFANAHPLHAGALGLTGSTPKDPQVQMLIQSFAFLSARVMQEMEASKASIANTLLEQLHPHLVAPLPSMAVAKLDVNPSSADGHTLPRGRQFTTTVRDDQGHSVDIRFRTTCATPLVPLEVVDARVLQPRDFPPHLDSDAVLSALRIRIKRLGTGSISALKGKRLRLHLSAHRNHAGTLHELLSANLIGISLSPTRMDEQARDVSGDLYWGGFSDDEAALVARPNEHPGLRLLQEYFAFPDKFLFFDTPDLPLDGVDDCFDLYFQFDRLVSKDLHITPQALQLNCVPVINLFSQRLEPLNLDHTRYEYPLSADRRAGRHCEVHSIEDLHSIKGDGTLRVLKPYFELESSGALDSHDYFYSLRRTECADNRLNAGELFISFLDVQWQAAVPAPEVVGGRALCTNAALAQRIGEGAKLRMDGPGPIKDIKLVTSPTTHYLPPSLGSRPWALASQLSLNYLSLTSGPQALAALKSILREHVGPTQRVGLRQIEGIKRIVSEQVLRPLVRGGMRGLASCLSIRLTLEHTHFEGIGALLFASVLRHFFTLYASVNLLIELTVETTDTQHPIITWPPLAGTKAVL